LGAASEEISFVVHSHWADTGAVAQTNTAAAIDADLKVVLIANPPSSKMHSLGRHSFYGSFYETRVQRCKHKAE